MFFYMSEFDSGRTQGCYDSLFKCPCQVIIKDFEKHFRIKSGAIKTWRFGDDMSSLSNENYCKLVNVI